MMKRIFLFLAAILSTTLINCAPAYIPNDASREWDFISGSIWVWGQPLEEGCVSWMASERWAQVQILVEIESQCPRETGYTAVKGKGLSYDTITDHLVFQGYWPWSGDAFNKLIVFDDEGLWIDTLPCPYSLSAEQIEDMHLVAAQALVVAKTPVEVSMLKQVMSRLSQMNGDNLAASQGGCADVAGDTAAREASRSLDFLNAHEKTK